MTFSRQLASFLLTLLLAAPSATEAAKPLGECPAAGDAAYGNKPSLDALNSAACGLDETFLFTSLVEDTTKEPNCISYCASCELGICDVSGGKATCSDSSKCTLCSDPPGCSGDDSSDDSAARAGGSCATFLMAAVLAAVAFANVLY